jgi:hypothetical protein
MNRMSRLRQCRWGGHIISLRVQYSNVPGSFLIFVEILYGKGVLSGAALECDEMNKRWSSLLQLKVLQDVGWLTVVYQ